MGYGFEEEYEEKDIYGELEEEIFEDDDKCSQCGSHNAIMGFDPYSEMSGATSLCEECMSEDFVTI